MRTNIDLIDTVSNVHTMIPAANTPREFVSVSFSGSEGREVSLRLSRAEATALYHSLGAGLDGDDTLSRMRRPKDYR